MDLQLSGASAILPVLVMFMVWIGFGWLYRTHRPAHR